VASEAKAGLWRLWVDIDGEQASPIINARTDGPEKCGPGSGGVQTVYVKFSRQPAPEASPPSTAPEAGATPDPDGYLFPNTAITRVDTNCGATQIIGRVENADGTGVDGLAIRVRTADTLWEVRSRPSENGDWEVALAPEAKAGLWRFWVEGDGPQLSPVINARTDGPERCGAGSGGVQTVYATFKR
jgi:hypothetical protein